AREARLTSGVTRRRMQAAAGGSACLALILVLAGVTAGLPQLSDALGEVNALLGVASGVAYVLAFAPPTWLRHAWQEPELRSFLGRTAGLSRLPDLRMIVRELEAGAAASLGAAGASIGLWDQHAARLTFFSEPPQSRPAGSTNRGLDNHES